ncbi:MAG: glucosylceramidase [Acidobacteria bacterium]|nr:MAG: glucosylceramidase [Acidobacteriota bacterium]PYY21040.1 MAG: glucosylceramidase [Acidobacteriota bacterium]
MKKLLIALCTLLPALLWPCVLRADDNIPHAAWRIPIGQPPANPGGHKPEISNIDDGFWQGAPVGGFGAGTFSRSYRGHYERWHLKAGVHKYEDVPANQFAVFVRPEGGEPIAQVLATDNPSHGLSAWNWSYPAGSGEYAALYPKSWFAYQSPQLPIKLTVEQFSPVLPDNYKETSYPVAIYNWYAQNPTSKPVTVSILFSWANMVGWFRDSTRGFAGGLNNQNTNTYHAEQIQNGNMQGIVFDRLRSGAVQEEWDGQFAIAALATPGVEVTYTTSWMSYGTGEDVWKPFSTDGRLPNWAPKLASAGEPMAAAIALRFTLAPNEKKLVPMALAWDLPIAEFGGGRKWLRHYTKFFGTSGSNAWKIARTALENDQDWSRQIDEWQKPFIEDESKPLWYRGELFNELYILADGGTLWGHELNGVGNPRHHSAQMADSFSYLECFDYQYYGTSDVRFYGSFPLVKFWPEIEKQEMRQYTDTIAESNPQEYVWAWKRDHQHILELMQRKTAGSAPHDLGSPTEDPFVNVNQYNYQDVSNWRDLNSKYVLMVWRDYVFSGSKDSDFLRYTWNAVKMAMEHLRQYDKNGDGLIENGGFPDQTYDNWVARGESSYSGSLYLAALRATAEIARKLGENTTAQGYDALFKRAQAAFVKNLWNGTYFNYDVGSDYKSDIMAEQLAGQWYANLTGLGEIVPAEMRRSALQHVFDFNVMKFQNGTMGAVNGIAANGDILHENEQVEEVWTGTTFGVASHMLSEGMRDQAFKTAEGVYNVVWKDRGYFFRTPEAYDSRGLFRASMYMRPGSIWSMEMTGKSGPRPSLTAVKGQ